MITHLDNSFYYLIVHSIQKKININSVIKDISKPDVIIVYATDFCVKIASKNSSTIDSIINQYSNNINIALIYDHNHELGGIDRRKEFFSEIQNPIPISDIQYYFARDFAKIYNFPSPNIYKSINIAIYSFQGSIFIDDVHEYWLKYCAIPKSFYPKVNLVSIDGQSIDPKDPSNTRNLTASINVQYVGALCPTPNTNITFYNGPNTDMAEYDITVKVLNESNPDVILITFGDDETKFDPKYRQAITDLFKIASEKGINTCVTCGYNKGSCSNGQLPLYFPSTIPYVTACGSTSILCPNLKYDSLTKEVVWHEEDRKIETCGGISTIFPQPCYQQNVVSPKFGCKGRTVPDISVQAGVCIYPSLYNYTAQYFIYEGKLTALSGSGFSAAIIAGFIAASRIRTFINPYLYRVYYCHPDAFHQITFGNNGCYNASQGYDLCTGLGSFDGCLLEKYILEMMNCSYHYCYMIPK
jgi:kumamolisin